MIAAERRVHAMATVRYLVRDVGRAVDFYAEALGFSVDQNFAPAMAILKKGDLTLWVAGPQASAARPMPDGRKPEPGGWNRFVLEVADLDTMVAELRAQGVPFRNEVVIGPGGRQILCEDPSGNAVELFQPG
jgi:catechol 2,3-dioxygenase-like lactoylglutathione lyase family enzyme